MLNNTDHRISSLKKKRENWFDAFGNARKFTTNGKDFQSSIERYQGRVLH